MIENMLVHRADVVRPVPSKGTSGAEEASDEDVYLDMPCSVQPISATWKEFYLQNHIKTSHFVFTNIMVRVKNGDKVLFNCRTFLVQGIRNLIELDRVLALDVLEVL